MDMKMVARKLRILRARRERLERVLTKVYEKLPGHLSSHDLERYHLGMVSDEAELGPLEAHLLRCGVCADRAEAARTSRGCRQYRGLR
jgi:hypothetical protein